MKNPIVRKVEHVSVSRFYEKYRDALELQLLNSPLGMSRYILQPSINRPGLALTGYFGYFAHERIQVFGAAEMAYLNSLQGEERRERLQRIFRENIPCLILRAGWMCRQTCWPWPTATRYRCSARTC